MAVHKDEVDLCPVGVDVAEGTFRLVGGFAVGFPVDHAVPVGGGPDGVPDQRHFARGFVAAPVAVAGVGVHRIVDLPVGAAEVAGVAAAGCFS